MNVSKILISALSAVAGAAAFAPAHAGTTELTCPMSQEDQAVMVQAGYPDSAATVMHVRIDTDAHTATDWATYPGETDPPKPVTYAATFKGTVVMWSTPPDPDDGSVAVRSLDESANILITLDPQGHSTHWNCN
jgi:hypothetical protein